MWNEIQKLIQLLRSCLIISVSPLKIFILFLLFGFSFENPKKILGFFVLKTLINETSCN